VAVAVIDEVQLSERFAALSSATRRAILARLAVGEATVNELAEPFQMSLPAISKHIKILERAGLIQRSQRAQYRPCALNPAALDEVTAWAARCRATWEARFDRLDDHIARIRPQAKGRVNPNE
jgi:DNA-binding transcriptional ArsR family regulator